MCCTRRILGLALLALLANIGGRAGAYTNQWAAHIEGGPEVARQVAQDHGFRFLAKIRSKANAAAEKCRGLTKTFDESQCQHNRTLKDDQAPLCSRHTRSNHQTGKSTLIPQCVSQFLREKSVTSQMINRSVRNKVLRKIVNVSLMQSAQHFSTMASKSQLSTVPKKLLMPGTVDHKMVVRCAGQLRRCICTREKTASLQEENHLDKLGARNFSRSASLEEGCPIYDRKPAGFVNRYAEQKSLGETERSKECRPRESVKEEELEGEDCMKVMHGHADKKCRELEEKAALRNTVSDQGREEGGAEKCQGETRASLSGNSVLRPQNFRRTCNRPVMRKRSSYVIPRPCPTPKINIYDHSLPDPPPPRVAHWSERQMSNSNFGGRRRRFETVKSSAMYYSPEQSIRKSGKPSSKSYFSLNGSKHRPGSRARYSTSSEGNEGKEGKEGKEHSDMEGKAVEKRTWTKERMLRLFKRECAASKFLQRADKKNNARAQESSRKREPSRESMKSEAIPAEEEHFQVDKMKPQKANVNCAESGADDPKSQKVNDCRAESAAQFKRSEKVSDSCAESTARHARPEKRSLTCEESATHRAESQKVNDCCAESAGQFKRSQKVSDSCAESTARHAKPERISLTCEESAADHAESQKVNDCCAESAAQFKRSQKVSDSCAESTARHAKPERMTLTCEESAADHAESQKVNDCCAESSAKHAKPERMSVSCEESAADYKERQNVNDCCPESSAKHAKLERMSLSCEESVADHAECQKVNDCCAESAAQCMRSQKASDSCTESTGKHAKPEKMGFGCEEADTDYREPRKMNSSCTESNAEHARFQRQGTFTGKTAIGQAKSDKADASHAESGTQRSKPQKMNAVCAQSLAAHKRPQKVNAGRAQPVSAHKKPQKANVSCAELSAAHERLPGSSKTRKPPPSCNQNSHRQEKQGQEDVSCSESVGEHTKCTDSAKSKDTGQSCKAGTADVGRSKKENVTCAEPVDKNTECAKSSNSKRPSKPDSEQKCYQSCAKCGENSPLCPNSQKATKPRSGKQKGQPISEHLMVEKVDVACADHTEKVKKTVGPAKKPKPPPSCINDSQDSKCMKGDQKQGAAKKCTNEQPPKKVKPSQAASSPNCPEGLTLPKPTKTVTDPPPVHILSKQGKLAPPKPGTIFHLSDICNCKPNVATLKYRLAKCPNMMEMRNLPEMKRPTHRLPARKKRNSDVLRSRSRIKKKEPSGEWSRQRYIVRLRIFKAQDGFNPAAPQMAEVKFGRSMDRSVDAQLQNMKKFEKHNKFVPQSTPPHRQQSQCAPKKCVLFKERDRMKRLKDSCAAQRNHEYYQRVMKKHGYDKKE